MKVDGEKKRIEQRDMRVRAIVLNGPQCEGRFIRLVSRAKPRQDFTSGIYTCGVAGQPTQVENNRESVLIDIP